MKRAGKILGDVLFAAAILVLLGGSLLFALNQDPGKTFFGYRAYNILSGSMEPELSVGDLVVVRAAPAETVQEGDIVTYYPAGSGGATVTHRVVSATMQDGEMVIETKGDAADQADPPVSGESVVGVVVFHIPLLGAGIAWIQAHPVLSAGGGILLLAIWLTGKLVWKKTRRHPSENA